MHWEEIPLSETDPAYDRTPFLNYARARRTDKDERDPIVGDVVHFWDDVTAKCMAATVVDTVWETDGQHSECLHVLDPDRAEARWLHAIPHSEPKKPLTWHWPCGGQ